MCIRCWKGWNRARVCLGVCVWCEWINLKGKNEHCMINYSLLVQQSMLQITMYTRLCVISYKYICMWVCEYMRVCRFSITLNEMAFFPSAFLFLLLFFHSVPYRANYTIILEHNSSHIFFFEKEKKHNNFFAIISIRLKWNKV